MGQSLVTHLSRRLWNISITSVVAAVLGSVTFVYDLSLRDARFLTGWFLVAGIAFLALYHARKTFPFLPLVRSSYWLQAHIYVGLLVVFLFLVHTSLAVPSGPLEVFLWLCFVVVAGSGVVGIALSRRLAERLRLHGERIIFERIPIFRAQCAREVADLARRSVTETASSTIARYYSSRLHDFFRGPRHFLAHLRESREPLRTMCREIGSLERYLDSVGKEILKEIEARVIAKNNLDYQHALQFVLKTWLFIHIALTYSLILVAVTHVVLVYAFTSGTL